MLAQTYPAWELLLVDDGSTDASAEIARAYAQRRPDRIRVLRHPGGGNRGKVASRNLGLAAARGAHVTFLDADDVLRPEKLERHAAVLDAHPRAGMVYGATEYWYSWRRDPRERRRDTPGRLGVPADRLYEPPELLARFLETPGIVPCLCGLLARRDVVMAVGGFDDAVPDLYEDQVLLAKICLRTPVFVASGVWERYRQHEASSSAAATRSGSYHPLRPNPARLAFLTWLQGYIAAQGIEDRALRDALDRALWPYRHPTLARIAGGPGDLRRWTARQVRRGRRLVERLRGAGRA